MADLQIHFKHVPTNQTVKFTAFIETFSDSFAAEWSSEKVFGRMDPIAQYKGTARTVNFNFTVPADSEEEATINHRKISKLLQFMYPTYEANQNIKSYVITAPPLMMVKFNNFIRNQAFARPESKKPNDITDEGLLGYIPDIKYEPDMNSNIFTIMSENDNNKTLLAFQSFKVGITLNVLHTHRLGWGLTSAQGTNTATVGPAEQRFPMGYDILGQTN